MPPANTSGEQAEVVIYSSDYCPYCMMAKRLLAGLNVDFDEITVDGKPAIRQQMTEKSGARTVPQIFIDEKPIGGSDDLHALQASGKLHSLLYPTPEK